MLEIDDFDGSNRPLPDLERLRALEESEPQFSIRLVEDDTRAWELRDRFAAIAGYSSRSRESPE